MSRTALEIYAHKHPVNGAWILSAIVGYERIERAYYFYTKREAMQLFRRDVAKRKSIRAFADGMKQFSEAASG
jgi:hypothetical protein